MDDKKKKLLKGIISAALIITVIVLIAVPAVKVLTSDYSAVIKDKEMNYYRARNLFICGSTLICRRDHQSAKEKSMLPEEGSAVYSFMILSMENIVSIEILPDDGSADDEALPVNQQHLGKYKIRLQGHEGILFLGMSKERVYGTVRFPQWGKGAVENLKGLRIGGGSVRFLRSASTPEEVKRLGANYLFKQKFSGKYNPSGKEIRGFMINDRGEKHEWEAVKK